MATTTDQNFKNTVSEHPGGEHALDCFLCGTCTAGCPVSAIDDGFNPRKIMRQILYGMKTETLSEGEIWKCNQCHACVAHCPQDVRFADIVRALRELAISEGHYDKSFADKIKEIDQNTKEQRLKQIKDLLK
ncbi:MAG: 4Fe-4S dicluster domain-containing protein [Oscillospiraceae bacterium]|jgi:heterodisulfide reductase subunit C|nr:4Fe-4S dicluster domain-containing protein [Oscillospiraceae bacterium]